MLEQQCGFIFGTVTEIHTELDYFLPHSIRNQLWGGGSRTAGSKTGSLHLWPCWPSRFSQSWSPALRFSTCSASKMLRQVWGCIFTSSVFCEPVDDPNVRILTQCLERGTMFPKCLVERTIWSVIYSFWSSWNIYSNCRVRWCTGMIWSTWRGTCLVMKVSDFVFSNCRCLKPVSWK